jgi:hypothetical protein
MDAFWCITLSIFVGRWWWKHQFPKQPNRPKFTPVSNAIALNRAIEKKSELQLQHERDIADLKRQGYTDEVIAVIMPTIQNG